MSIVVRDRPEGLPSGLHARMRKRGSGLSEGLWWQQGVIYQIYPRSFQDRNRDGVGDLPGILTRVDYLADVLGIDAVWLSPFYPSPMADFGYDVSDYTDVHPLFGTLEDFDRLITALHARDIKLIIDFVPNHSSDQHPWFLESRSSRDAAKRDWYIWRDPKPDGSPPNNWLSNFGGSAWAWDEATQQYYLHAFLKEQPDLNWRNPEVREAMYAAMRFWLDRGVDGFRLDAVLHVAKDPEMRDNPPNPDTSARHYEVQLHPYDRGYPSIHDTFREMRQLVDSYTPPRVLIGEIYEDDWSVWASYYGRNDDELHLPFNFSLLFTPFDAVSLRSSVDSAEAAVPVTSWPNHVVGNHDNPRVATRIGLPAARLAQFMLLTLRGTPTLYYGDELGMADVPIPEGKQRDPIAYSLSPDKGRDPERTPMQWDGGPNAGFCDPDVEPWLPVASDWREVNVQRELGDASSMLVMIRSLLDLRRRSGALRLGSYRPVDTGSDNCFVFLREYGDERRLVALNVSNDDARVPLEHPAIICLSTHGGREGEQCRDTLHLHAYEGAILTLEP